MDFQKVEGGKLVFEAGSCHYTKLTLLGLYVTLRGPNVLPQPSGGLRGSMWSQLGPL